MIFRPFLIKFFFYFLLETSPKLSLKSDVSGDLGVLSSLFSSLILFPWLYSNLFFSSLERGFFPLR
jgi:hypothetical protein